MSLEGKRALITGASGALGAAMAERLARDGATVLLHANSRPEAVEQLAATIAAAGGKAECHVFDLRSDEACRVACERMLEDGPVQIVVNNAGVHDDAVLPGMRAEQWHKVIDVSLNGFFRVTQPLLLPMMRTRWGRVLNISFGLGADRQPRAGQLCGRQGCAQQRDQGVVARSGVARRHGQRHCAGHHRLAHGRRNLRPRHGQPDGPDEARRNAAGSGGAGLVPGQRRGGLHHGAGDFDQWWND